MRRELGRQHGPADRPEGQERLAEYHGAVGTHGRAVSQRSPAHGRDAATPRTVWTKPMVLTAAAKAWPRAAAPTVRAEKRVATSAVTSSGRYACSAVSAGPRGGKYF